APPIIASARSKASMIPPIRTLGADRCPRAAILSFRQSQKNNFRPSIPPKPAPNALDSVTVDCYFVLNLHICATTRPQHSFAGAAWAIVAGFFPGVPMSVAVQTKRVTVPEIRAHKGQKPVVCLTCYHAHTAKLLDQHVDLMLVGDSLGNVM